jgi:hypothetical protein
MFKFLEKIFKKLFKKEEPESLFWKEYCETIKRKDIECLKNSLK